MCGLDAWTLYVVILVSILTSYGIIFVFEELMGGD